MVENTVVTQETAQVAEEIVQAAQNVWGVSDVLDAANVGISFLLLLITGVSVFCAYLAYQHQKKRAKKDAACDLARNYADTILLENQIVMNVFGWTGLDTFVKETFPMAELDDFSIQEMHKFAAESGITPEDLKKKMENIDPQIILIAMLRGAPSFQERVLMRDLYSEIDEGTGKRIVKKGFETELQSKFVTKVLCLANKLEWFSMKCRYGLADEELLYQSLHQTFLSMVWMMYYFICKNNININDKYYTNTIWLFKKWYARLSEHKNNAEKEAEEAMETIREAQKKIEKAGQEHIGKPLH